MKNNKKDDIDEMDRELSKVTGKYKKDHKPVNWKQLLGVFGRVIMGIGKLIAVMSIVCSSFLVLNSDIDQFFKWLVVPQVILAFAMSIKAFILNGDK